MAYTKNVYVDGQIIDANRLNHTEQGIYENSQKVDTLTTEQANIIAALAPEYSANETYSVGQYAWRNGALYKCIIAITTAESFNSAHWKIEPISDGLHDLRETVKFDEERSMNFLSDQIGICEYLGWEDYRIFTNTSVIDVYSPDTVNSGWFHIIVPCSAGDRLHVKVDNANSSARPWCFVDASYNKLSVASVNVVDVDIIAPTNSAYLICNSRYAKGFVYKGESIISPIAYANDVQKNGSFTFTAGKYIAVADGTEQNNVNYHITNFIPIPKKTQAIEHNFYNSVSGADGYAFYDISRAFISGGKNPYKSAEYLMTIPTNATYVRFSSRISYEESGVDRFVSFYAQQNYKPLNGKTIVMLGDSIVGNYNGINSIPDFLKRITGANCINCAFGGSNMATDTVGSVNQLLLPFRGFKVIESIVNNDYTEMLSAIASDPNFETLIDYYPVHVANLQNIDWTNVDIITLSFGTNDWGTSVALADNSSDLYDTDTFGGAWRTALKTLFEKYPNIKVMIFGPIWRGGTITNGELDYDSDNHVNVRNAYLYEYSEKEESVAKEFHVPFVNMYDTICFNSYTWKSYFPTSASNAVHPNANGRYVMSKRYAEQLRNL